jgi:hypothetical protein
MDLRLGWLGWLACHVSQYTADCLNRQLLCTDGSISVWGQDFRVSKG